MIALLREIAFQQVLYWIHLHNLGKPAQQGRCPICMAPTGEPKALCEFCRRNPTWLDSLLEDPELEQALQASKGNQVGLLHLVMEIGAE